MAEIVRRRSWGGVLPLGRHASISGPSLSQCASVSIALSSFQEGQNARHHNRFRREQALVAQGTNGATHSAYFHKEHVWSPPAIPTNPPQPIRDQNGVTA